MRFEKALLLKTQTKHTLKSEALKFPTNSPLPETMATAGTFWYNIKKNAWIAFALALIDITALVPNPSFSTNTVS